MDNSNRNVALAVQLIILKTRLFRKHNWVAFVIANISELEKGNGELYMVHGNLNITMVYLRFS